MEQSAANRPQHPAAQASALVWALVTERNRLRASDYPRTRIIAYRLDCGQLAQYTDPLRLVLLFKRCTLGLRQEGLSVSNTA